MLAHNSRPSGRRIVTPAMARARLALDIAPTSEAGRGPIIVAFKRGARALGAPKGVVELVLYLASRTKACDWLPGAVCIAHPSNRDLEVELCVGRSRVKSLIRAAAEWGFLTCVDSPTGRRYARRDPVSGQISVGYGFDLSPLSRRHAEFRAAIAAQEEREREAGRLRRHIVTTAALIKGFADGFSAEDQSDAELVGLAAAAAAVVARRGRSWDVELLSRLGSDIDALMRRAETRVSLLLPVETDPLGGQKQAPITSTNPPALATALVETEGRSAPSAQEKERSRASRAFSAAPSAAAIQSDPLRGFLATPGLFLRIAPELRDLCPTSKPTDAQILEACSYQAERLGISNHAWGQACVTLGRRGACAALTVIAHKSARHQISSPGGYLRKMVERHLAGELHLDRTLFGIVEEAGLRGVG